MNAKKEKKKREAGYGPHDLDEGGGGKKRREGEN